MEDARSEPVCIVGSGAAGLITAQILLQDGFKDVQIISRDAGPGGVWAQERVYDGLFINNVNGEYCFSCLEKTPADPRTPNLSGFDMCAYMTRFAEKFLQGKIVYNTEVRRIRRGQGGRGWELDVSSKITGEDRVVRCARLVLCSGGCHEPSVPPNLTVARAKEAGFKGRVLHTSDFRKTLDSIGPEGATALGRIVVVGGGKSAQDVCAYFARWSIPVTMVFERADAFISTSKPLPEFIRKSRFLGMLSPHIHLRTALERFLHTTYLGSKLVHLIWNAIAQSSYAAQGYPASSPIRNATSIFWSIRTNDDGPRREDHFHALVNARKIELKAPSRAIGYDEGGLVLADGGKVAADTVILGTGYTSSWKGLFDDETAEDLGINRHPPNPDIDFDQEWQDYRSLDNPPGKHAASELPASSIYRGLVPAKNLFKRDFAINGAVFNANNGYCFEVFAHWISSYFLGDPLRLPSTTEEAMIHAERQSAWLRKRYPDELLWVNESYSSNVTFWAWPQHVDDLLEDMGVPIFRSGGNWLTWPVKVIDIKEISTLGEERRALREARQARGEQ
ncbi:FAD/NAD(P)-binding domain-containing protein [Schizophyllum commune Tattone D]|nr:FAD/NAD(P)-binding domain-containing protein [Schizophyllum commune Tattone D]